jgi:fimbrial isopeptide formation D2 family protein/LPXTG-motif cell wall-anchored protein
MKERMKNMKLLVALVLALALTLSVCPALAAGTITITDDHPQGTDPDGTAATVFHYYGILRASINGDAISYYLLNGTDDDLRSDLDALTISGTDVFTFTQSADGTRWNVALNSSITDGEALANALNTVKTHAFADGEFTMNNGTATASVDDGYYLVTSSLGSKLVLDTFSTVSINTKNEYHTDNKVASKTNMEVGDIVTYTITVHIPETYVVGEYVTVHDTLDNHLDFKAATLAASLNGTDVELVDGTKKAESETFAKRFAITSDMLGKDVVITYDAELLSTAADDTGYVNTEFSNYSDYETNPHNVRVWTFDFDLDKNFQNVTGDDAANYSATFKLEDSDGNRISFIIDSTGYVKADADDTTNATYTNTLTINGKDNINIRGLEAGNYTLTELTTATGYNLLTDAITVTITDTSDADCATNTSKTPSHTVSYKIGNGDTATGTVTIQNNTGTELPSTGGIGTTIFYVAGIVLVLGAAAIIIARRKAEQN